jgi:hypothetical protein
MGILPELEKDHGGPGILADWEVIFPGRFYIG